MNRIHCWTDMPITALGDKPGVEAPIRAVEVLTYDGDKFCMVRVGGVVVEIKAGHLYEEPGRSGYVPRIMRDILRSLPREMADDKA